MSVALGADHAGYDLKCALLSWLREQGYDVVDVGAYSMDPLDDYPDFSQAVAQSVASGQAQRGIIVCGSGVGGSIAANKVPGARASICHDTYSAGQGVEHDDMNVLCLGARVIGEVLARDLVTAFLSAQFLDEEKYRRRLDKVIALEQSALNANVTPAAGG
ncbi:MAG: RpiB/LacA/LacB family sugar-phosphate isomerase [Chloroflexota bacterium]|nr:RpiB/LacA/LacB family sugar-phosphate isomerase [Chloroflexota bacterium]MDE2940757.1 RpiB/LacA/LacB family sugar-phosphate isomerase [Chloroflexota bacterium]MDE3266939.1 RpiB/LacA/LacB family sugar-phosphate isomerase [Chloroflexota bacterium]